MTTRRVGLLLHADRDTVQNLAADLIGSLESRGVDVFELDPQEPVPSMDLLVVLGGDGTMLRAAELAHGAGIPILGVNLGRVGFLAEAEPTDLQTIADWVARGDWLYEVRITLDVQVLRRGEPVWASFALNEVAVEKADRALMTELRVDVDGAPVMAWSGDGLLAATPTGSTAYAFSAGGPVIWPTADVMAVVPISAHALFARPLVLAPNSRLDVVVLDGPAVITCDGRRTFDVDQGDVVEIVRGHESVRFARLHQTSFTQRLVAKFHLPTVGWRARRDQDA